MSEFTIMIMQFQEKGEKTGWTYIEVPQDIAQKLKPGNNKTFRVKGFLDHYAITGIALLPIGEGNFIMPLNAAMRKGIGKRKGAMLHVRIEADHDFKITIPVELEECLLDEPEAFDFFKKLSSSHQGYFIKWISSAKAEETRIKRIEHTISALCDKIDYGTMIRRIKKNRDELLR